jgi:hypothetical protein
MQPRKLQRHRERSLEDIDCAIRLQEEARA